MRARRCCVRPSSGAISLITILQVLFDYYSNYDFDYPSGCVIAITCNSEITCDCCCGKALEQAEHHPPAPESIQSRLSNHTRRSPFIVHRSSSSPSLPFTIYTKVSKALIPGGRRRALHVC